MGSEKKWCGLRLDSGAGETGMRAGVGWTRMIAADGWGEGEEGEGEEGEGGYGRGRLRLDCGVGEVGVSSAFETGRYEAGDSDDDVSREDRRCASVARTTDKWSKL